MTEKVLQEGQVRLVLYLTANLPPQVVEEKHQHK